MSGCGRFGMISFLQWMPSRPRTWPNCHGFGIRCVMGFISHGRGKCYGYIPLQTDGRSVYRKFWWMRPGGWLSCQHARNTDCWWAMGEVALDWVDIPVESLLLVDSWGEILHTREPMRLVLFDAFGNKDGQDNDPEDTDTQHRTSRRGIAWMTGIYPLSLSQGNLPFFKQDPPPRLPPYPHDGQSGVRQITRQFLH